MGDIMARPVKCDRCGRVVMSTARRNTRPCSYKKTRTTPALCNGRMSEVEYQEYYDYMRDKQ